MSDSDFLLGTILIGLSTLVVFTAMALIGLTRAGPQRPGLVAGAVPLALVVPAATTIYVAFKQIGAYAALADLHAGGAARFTDASSSLWLLLRFAWGSAAGLCLLGLLVASIPSHAPSTRCSTGRGLVLLLLPLLGVVTSGLHGREYSRGLRVSAAVMVMDEKDPESKRLSDTVLESEGLLTEGAGGIAAVSRFIARSMFVGAAGGFVVVIILLGLAATGFILAWRVAVEGPLKSAALAIWLLAVVIAGLVALGFFNPLRLSPA